MIEYKQSLTIKSSHFVFFLFIIFILLVVFRLLYSNPIEFNGESILKWQLGRTILETKDWGLLIPKDSHEAHHELRWSVIIPQIMLAAFSPQGYVSYFVTPILFYSFYGALCCDVWQASRGTYCSEHC